MNLSRSVPVLPARAIRTVSILRWLATGAALVLLTACNLATPSPAPTVTPAAPTLAASTPTPTTKPAIQRVDIADNKLPSIAVSQGTTVVWTNRDQAPHTTTAGTPGITNGPWDSPVLDSGKEFSFTFSQPGEFAYWCRVHPGMTGKITVR
ncbi:MAG: plastocyanin [SAR202 cluster bacterium]|nr:plastocyanin [SAR202 cluster bacterium]